MDINHPGPLIIHLSQVPEDQDVHDYDGTGEWVKIFTMGLEWREDEEPPLYWRPYNNEELPPRVSVLVSDFHRTPLFWEEGMRRSEPVVADTFDTVTVHIPDSAPDARWAIPHAHGPSLRRAVPSGVRQHERAAVSHLRTPPDRERVQRLAAQGHHYPRGHGGRKTRYGLPPSR